MKLVHREILFDHGHFSSSSDWLTIQQHIVGAIESVVHPQDSTTFTIFQEKQANGVLPIKQLFIKYLETKGWSKETVLYIAQRNKPGKIDATYEISKGSSDPKTLFAVEWETGNISSSHRALNKMTLGIMRGLLLGGVLIIPTRNLYYFLTDRVGNYEELQPYFDLWKNVKIREGILAVYAVEHDTQSVHVQKIPKGTDGRALR